MTYDELKQHVMEFFGDTSRPVSETKEGLLAIADDCKMLADSIQGESP